MSVTLKSTSLRNSNFSEFICQWAERNIFWCLQGTFYAVRMWAERQSSVRFLCLHAPRNREKRPRRQNTSQALTWSLTKLFIYKLSVSGPHPLPIEKYVWWLKRYLVGKLGVYVCIYTHFIIYLTVSSKVRRVTVILLFTCSLLHWNKWLWI